MSNGYNESKKHSESVRNMNYAQPLLPRPTVFQSFLIGSVAGATEVMLNHPLWSIKIRIQCGDPFTLNPRLLYRGILANIASIIPSATLQVGLNRFSKIIFC